MFTGQFAPGHFTLDLKRLFNLKLQDNTLATQSATYLRIIDFWSAPRKWDQKLRCSGLVEYLLKFSRRPIADGWMQALLIIHLFEKVTDTIFGLCPGVSLPTSIWKEVSTQHTNRKPITVRKTGVTPSLVLKQLSHYFKSSCTQQDFQRHQRTLRGYEIISTHGPISHPILSE